MSAREDRLSQAVRELEKSVEAIVCACHEYRHSNKQLYDAIEAHDTLVKNLKTEKLPSKDPSIMSDARAMVEALEALFDINRVRQARDYARQALATPLALAVKRGGKVGG